MVTKKKQIIQVNVSKEQYSVAKDGNMKTVYIPGTDERIEELKAFNRKEAPNCVISLRCGGGRVDYAVDRIEGRVKITGQMINDKLYRNYFIAILGDQITE